MLTTLDLHTPPTNGHADGLLRGDALPVGAQLHNGRYRVESVLGRGGFGITYAARDCHSNREVAVKEYFPPTCRRDEFCVVPGGNFEAWERGRQAFGRGARTMEKLRHSAIVRFHEHFSENNTLYAVMERLRGRTLQDALENGPLPELQAREAIVAVAGALDAVHRMRLLHLDIKPENVMLCGTDGFGASDLELGSELYDSSQDQKPKTQNRTRFVLFDFDLLQEVERDLARTRPLGATHAGTPGYAPLEQYSTTAPLSYATDVYALGATFYHLLTGEAPSAATDRVLGVAVRAPRQLNPQISREASAAAMRALEVQPHERAKSVSEFLRVLEGETPATPPTTLGTRHVVPQVGAENWRLVGTLSDDPEFPDLCACCGTRASLDLPMKSEGRVWFVPHCLTCARHIKADGQAARGATWGMVLSLLLAAFGFLIAVLFLPEAGILLPPPAVVIFFTAMAYGALKGQVADALMRDNQCCSRSLSVAYGGRTGNGGAHLWKFRSSAYAEHFVRENGANVVALT